MATVADNIFAFAQRIDPYSKAGVALTSSTVLTTDGDRFAVQEKVDLYNQARFALFGVLSEQYTPAQMRMKLTEALVVKSDLQFTLTGSVSTAPKPTGFLRAESLTNATFAPIIFLDISKVQAVRSGNNPLYAQSSTRMYAFDIGASFIHYGTYVTSASTYILHYYGLTTWTSSSGASVEQFNDEMNWVLVETMVKMAEDIGSGQAYNYVRSLLSSQAT